MTLIEELELAVQDERVLARLLASLGHDEPVGAAMAMADRLQKRLDHAKALRASLIGAVGHQAGGKVMMFKLLTGDL